MNLFAAIAENWGLILVWGLVATAVMTTVLEGAQLLGLSRMSLPFLFGTMLTDRRRSAMIWGYFLYLLGGWLFAILYALILEGIGSAWWMGLLLGLAHGMFLVSVSLPLLPYVHPRMATEYDGPAALGRLEPPGAFGLHYGRATPVTTVAAQTVYGLIFAIGYHG
jgi:hypothetical protein